jgi:crotonobetainyl-CoA:carnitine CoA-transferase CaiB-like acyl-CoA transferase
MHKSHSSVPVDLRQRDDRSRLGELIAAADVVITSVRPRALAQLELWPHDQVARRPGLTWVAITAYGLRGPWANRVGYGDDTAAAGGLVAIDGSPVFCADAAADPCTGLYAAIAATAVAGAGGGVVDVALREVAAHLARAPHRTEPAHLRRVDVALPRARTA